MYTLPIISDAPDRGLVLPRQRYLVPILSPAQPLRRGFRVFIYPAPTKGRLFSRSSTCSTSFRGIHLKPEQEEAIMLLSHDMGKDSCWLWKSYHLPASNNCISFINGDLFYITYKLMVHYFYSHLPMIHHTLNFNVLWLPLPKRCNSEAHMQVNVEAVFLFT